MCDHGRKPDMKLKAWSRSDPAVYPARHPVCGPDARRIEPDRPASPGRNAVFLIEMAYAEAQDLLTDKSPLSPRKAI